MWQSNHNKIFLTYAFFIPYGSFSMHLMQRHKYYKDCNKTMHIFCNIKKILKYKEDHRWKIFFYNLYSILICIEI